MDLDRIVQRARAILVTPKAEWPVIAAEPATVSSLYTRYVLVLAAVPAICAFLKASLIGYGTPVFGNYREDVGSGIGGMLAGYAINLVMVYVTALVVDGLAPSFGARKDRIQALKTVAYAYTAFWLAGIGQLLHWLGALVLLAGAAYSIYLLHLSLPHTMKAPPDRAAGYTAVIVVITIALGWIVALLTGGIVGSAMVIGGLSP